MRINDLSQIAAIAEAQGIQAQGIEPDASYTEPDTFTDRALIGHTIGGFDPIAEAQSLYPTRWLDVNPFVNCNTRNEVRALYRELQPMVGEKALRDLRIHYRARIGMRHSFE